MKQNSIKKSILIAILKCNLILYYLSLMQYVQLGVLSTIQNEFIYQGPFMNICKDGLENIDLGCCSAEVGRYRFLRHETIGYNDIICITDSIAIGKSSR